MHGLTEDGYCRKFRASKTEVDEVQSSLLCDWTDTCYDG